MSNPRSGRGGNPMMPELPQGAVVSTYDHYADAKQAVDRLARSEFPVNQISILGNELRSVERVTGRLTYGRVALMGAMSGAYLGLFLGLLLFIFQPENTAIGGVFIAAIAIGAGFGMLFGVLSYAMNRNRRDFSSILQFVATRYDLIVPGEFVAQARSILGGSHVPAAPAHGSRAQTSAVAPAEPKSEPTMPAADPAAPRSESATPENAASDGPSVSGEAAAHDGANTPESRDDRKN